MTVPLVELKFNPAASNSSTPGPITAAQLALARRSDLVHWFDAERGCEPLAGGLITRIGSPIAPGGVQRALYPRTPSDAPSKVLNAPNSKPAVLCGMTAIGGSYLSTDVNRVLDGDANTKMPGVGSGAVAGTVVLSGGAVSSIPVSSGGSGYTLAPVVVLTGGGGSGATATANVTGGVVTSITVNAGGSGYTSAPTATLVAQLAPFTVAMLGATRADSAGAFWSFGDNNKYATGDFTSAGTSKFNANRGAGTPVVSGSSADNDGAAHLWEWTWDGTTAKVLRDGVQKASGALAMSGYTSRVISFGSVPPGLVSPPGGAGVDGYWEFAIVGSGVSADLHAAIKAIALEKHPSMTIA